MKKIFPVLLASLIAVQAASAGIMPVQLDGIRAVTGRDSGVSKVKYRIEEGPGAAMPDLPPNLTEEQYWDLLEFLAPDLRNPPLGAVKALPGNLTKQLLQRVAVLVKQLDINFKRPIPKAEWDQILKSMKADFVEQHGLPGAARSGPDWEAAIDGLLTGMVKKFDDPHTVYMNPAQAKSFNEQMESSFVGIGVGVGKVPEGLKIETVYIGSPAEKAGLHDGDVITAIDGVATKDQDVQTIIGRLRGTAGTEVKVRVPRLSDPVVIVRGAVQMPSLFAKMAAPGIGYVHFSSFIENMDERVFVKIDELKASGAAKLIIDLRGNGGGLINIAESIGSEFLRDSDVVTMTKRQGQIATKAITVGTGRYFGMPLVFILNGGSASASEMLAGGLQESRRAIVVGSVSYGKGSFQDTIDTQDGAMLKVTLGGWYTPNDQSVEGVHDPKTEANIPGSGGVKPDVAVTMTEAEEMAAMKSIQRQLHGRPAEDVKDASLEKAIEVLNRP